jgi:hypothetical protein
MKSIMINGPRSRLLLAAGPQARTVGTEMVVVLRMRFRTDTSIATFHHGAFKAGMKMVFTDSTAWMVRFPRFGMVCEKVISMERRHPLAKTACHVGLIHIVNPKLALRHVVHVAQGQLWVDNVNEAHMTGRLCQWVSTFHRDITDHPKTRETNHPGRAVSEDHLHAGLKRAMVKGTVKHL